MVKKNRWLIATNTENLKNIIAQGLIAEPSGFKKYYSDVLEISPGRLLVFNNSVPKEIFDKSMIEDPTLNKCIIEFSFDNINGTVECLKEFTNIKTFTSIDGDDRNNDLFNEENKKSHVNENENIDVVNIEDIQNYQAMYVQLPLPLSSIKSIIFDSKELKDKFISEVNLIPNISIVDFPLKVEPKLFNTFSKISILEIKLHPIQEIDYPLVYAYGGLLTMLFYYAKNGELSNNIFYTMSNLGDFEEKINENIEWICNYFKMNNENVLDIYRELLDVIKISDTTLDGIIQVLEAHSDSKTKKRTQELAEILKEFIQNPQKTPSEYFAGVKKPLEKWLLMLFFKERSEDLIEYPTSNKIIDFSEEDYILFAMIFGMRDNFLNLSKELREIKGLQNFISLKMASYAHKLRKSNLQIKIKKEDEPLTLTDMFKKNEFKILFSKQNKIDCLTSILKLPKGSRTEHNNDSAVYYKGNLHDYIVLNIDDKEFYKPLLLKIVSKDEYKKYLTQYQKC